MLHMTLHVMPPIAASTVKANSELLLTKLLEGAYFFIMTQQEKTVQANKLKTQQRLDEVRKQYFNGKVGCECTK